ncbi:MAG: hypothetical protein EXR76_11390 [Myxococcales bacterium]|nr:hypothetical protein [Myxococcales bacterium]
MTWADCGSRCRAFADAVRGHGYGQSDAVTIMGETSPEWLIADSVSCNAIGEMTEDMARWDTLQGQIAALDPAAACRFLDEHAPDMRAYLDTTVPQEPTSAGMQKGALFEKKLKAAMQSDCML